MSDAERWQERGSREERGGELEVLKEGERREGEVSEAKRQKKDGEGEDEGGGRVTSSLCLWLGVSGTGKREVRREGRGGGGGGVVVHGEEK